MAQTLRYKKEFGQKLIEHMSRGLSYESFGPEVGVHRFTLYEWEKKYPEWLESKREAQDKAFSFWEKLFVAKAFGQKKEADIAAIIFCLKTRFHKHYGERHKVEEVKPVSDLTLNELKAEFNALVGDESAN